MVMKKHIVPITFLFIFIKKINIQKTHKMKKKTKYQTNIFLSWENYLFFYLRRELMRTKSTKEWIYV